MIVLKAEYIHVRQLGREIAVLSSMCEKPALLSSMAQWLKSAVSTAGKVVAVCLVCEELTSPCLQFIDALWYIWETAMAFSCRV